MGAPIARALAEADCTLALHNRTRAKAEAVAADCPNSRVCDTAAEAAQDADFVILAVKPHLLPGVLQEVVAVEPSAVMVSLAPGISLRQLKEFGAEYPLRLMPNVAIACGEGISFISAPDELACEADMMRDLLVPTGEVFIVEERLFEPLMALTSCGIAFALRYVRASAEGAVAMGVRPDDAAAWAAATLRGAAALIENNPGKHPEALIDSVTTPGGSTIRGLLAMEQHGFSAAVAAGLLATQKK